MTGSELLKYRKRPVVVEAHKFDGIGATMPAEFQAAVCRGACFGSATWDGTPHIHTLEGPHHVSAGDWIIKGIKGEMYPCKPDIFEASYERADSRAALAPVVAEVVKEMREIVAGGWHPAERVVRSDRLANWADRLERGE